MIWRGCMVPNAHCLATAWFMCISLQQNSRNPTRQICLNQPPFLSSGQPDEQAGKARTGVGQLDLAGAIGDGRQVADGVTHRHRAQWRAHCLWHRRVLRADTSLVGPCLKGQLQTCAQRCPHMQHLGTCRCFPLLDVQRAPIWLRQACMSRTLRCGSAMRWAWRRGEGSAP